MSTADFTLLDEHHDPNSGPLLVNLKQKKGIKIKDLSIGTGRVAEPGRFAVIKYQGFSKPGRENSQLR